jgi:hypothetical protein
MNTWIIVHTQIASNIMLVLWGIYDTIIPLCMQVYTHAFSMLHIVRSINEMLNFYLYPLLSSEMLSGSHLHTNATEMAKLRQAWVSDSNCVGTKAPLWHTNPMRSKSLVKKSCTKYQDVH